LEDKQMIRVLKVVLSILVVAAVVVGVAVVVSPNVTLQNMCGHPLALPADIPLVGKELKVGNTQVKAPPGDYTLTRIGTSLRVVGPAGIDVTVDAPQGGVKVTKDGQSINLAQASQKISLGPGSNAVVQLCTNP
jgi:hypothetical protein